MSKELGSAKALWGHKAGNLSLDMARSQLETDSTQLEKDMTEFLTKLQYDLKNVTRSEVVCS